MNRDEVAKARIRYNQVAATASLLARIRRNMRLLAEEATDDPELMEEYQKFEDALDRPFVILGACMRRLDLKDNG